MQKAAHAAHIGERQTLSFLGGVIRALLSSLGSGAALLLVLAYFLYRFPEKANLLTPLAFLIATLCGLVGGFGGGRALRRAGALCGITAGIVLVFLFLLVALILRAGVLSQTAIPLYLLILVSATVGGAWGARKPQRHKRR